MKLGVSSRAARRTPQVWGVLLLALILLGLPAAALAAWQPPLDAPIVDAFRPPASRYGAGNRGLEYGASPGQAFSAVDSGRVTFAGRVGRSLHVTIDHGDGLRSTYAFVETISVARGQHISKGQFLGTAGPGFHLTARLGEVYVDPELLFGGYEVQISLTKSELPKLTGSIRRQPSGRSGFQ